MQDDYEYILFNRNDFGTALVRAMDYVLAITSIPFETKIEGPNKINIQVGGQKSYEEQLGELKRFIASQPKNVQSRIALAKMMHKKGDTLAV